MASIDERVVAMSFENAKFEAGVATTMATLSKLDASIKNIGATSGLSKIEAESRKITLTGPMSALDKLQQKLGLTGGGAAYSFGEISSAGSKVTLEQPMSALDKLQQKLGLAGQGAPQAFGEIEKASSKVTLEGIIRACDNVAAKFSIVEGAAAVAFGNIASKAALMGGAFVKSFSLGPVTQGFQEYSTNLNSIQTILANTKASGTDLQDVNAALQQLNDYSDKTIYNFGQMANAIGLFTAAGVDLKTSVSAIKGISNLAALSGSDNEKAAHAMTQLSQAIAAGKVTLQDWVSVRNAGMGGTVFQRALAQTAQAMGTLDKGAVKLTGSMKNASINGESFTESIRGKPGETSWLTSKVLTTTLAQFTGDLKDADLAAQGFNQSQIDAIQETARAAKLAATEVKTLPQVFDVAKETIGSGWSATFQNIFGNFTEAKSTFTELSNTINGFINQNADARNKVLADWKELGGRTDLIDGIKTAFRNLMDLLGAVSGAFRDIFPRKTGEDLADLTSRFKNFMESLTPSAATIDNLRRIFAGLFAVVDIGWTVIKKVVGVIFDLIGVVGEGSGGFLSFVASIGDFLVALDNAITKGDALSGIFTTLGAVLSVPLEIIKELAGALFDLFGGTDAKQADGVASSLDKLNQALEPLRGTLDVVQRGWEKFLDILGKIRELVEPAFTKMVDFLGTLGNQVAEAFNNIDWSAALQAVETGLIGAIFLKLKKLFSGGLSVDVGGGFLSNINKTISALTDNLKTMQQNLQAATLLEIAIAIGILAAGILTLSSIPADKLSSAMSAVAVGLGQLVAVMVILNKAVAGGGFLKLPFIAGSMILLATAVTILAVAMKIMASMDWGEIAKGLAGVGGVLAAVGIATQLINGPKLIAAGLAMIPLAIGINLLAVAVKIFASMNWEELGRGLAGVVVALLGIAMAMSVMPPNLLLTGAGLIAVGIGLTLLAGAVGAFGNMDLKAMVQGILGVAGALVAIGLAVALIPPTIALQAAGLLILAVALNGIAAAVAIFGAMDLESIIKGLTAMAGVLLIFAIGLTAMEGTLPGSVALLAAAAALAILAPTLAFLGTLKWSTIFKGLAAIGLSLGLIAVMGLVAAPALIAIGVALAILGVGLLAVGAAAYLFGKAFALVGAEGTKAFATLIAAVGAFIVLFPKMVIDFVKGLVTILAEIVKLAPTIATALVKIATTLLDAIIALSPKVAEAIGALVVLITQVLADNVPILIAAGFTLMVGLLTGMRDNLPKILTLATDIVVKFITGLGENAPRIVKAGADTLVQFITGITSHLGQIVATVAAMVKKFLDAVTSHIPAIVKSGANLIVKFLVSIATAVPRFVAAGTRIILAFLDGVAEAIPRLVKKGLEVAKKFANGIADGLSGLADIGFRAIIRFLHGLEKAIRDNFDELFQAGAGVADAIIDGLIDQFGKLSGLLRRVLDSVFGALPGWAKKILGIHSPSTVFAEIGKFVMLGMAQGLEDGGDDVNRSIENVAQDVIDQAKAGLGKIPELLEGIIDMDPVITPVLDLSQLERDAAKVDDMTNVVPISAAASFDQASAISDQQQVAQAASAEAAGTSFEFNQYNTSPEKLSEIEIYRQTKNQLSQVKLGLGLAN